MNTILLLLWQEHVTYVTRTL